MKTHDKNVIRIIDANLNRAREGMRVCEDICRFILDDAGLSKDLKSIRHRLQSVVAGLKISKRTLLKSRDSKQDVGADYSSLENKKSWQDIFFASIQRVKESLRVLEEFSKLSDESSAAGFKRLRFAVYDFEKQILRKI